MPWREVIVLGILGGALAAVATHSALAFCACWATFIVFYVGKRK